MEICEMKTWIKTAFTAAALTVAASGAQAATIVNGNFETLGSGIPGWTVSPGNEIIVVPGSAYIPCCGASGTPGELANNFVTFGPGNIANTSTLSQIFSTIAGQLYTVKFDFGVMGNGPQTLFAEILNAGGPTITAGTWTRTANNNLTTTFGTSSLSFIAGSASTELKFKVDPVTNSVDGILDNVSIAAVPEPATWLMMIFGFGLVGGAMRYRQRQPAKVTFG
jgi:hypothetical protein